MPSMKLLQNTYAVAHELFLWALLLVVIASPWIISPSLGLFGTVGGVVYVLHVLTRKAD